MISSIQHGRQLDDITIDSKDRETNSTSTTNFRITVEQPSMPAKWLQLVKIVLPMTFDTIDSNNNTFDIGALGTITIPTGHYELGSLILELNSLTTGYTWTWENNSRIKVVKDDLATFTLDPGNATILLGFDPSSTYTGANNYTADFFPDMGENKDYLTLHSSVLRRHMEVSVKHTDDRTNMITFIKNDVPHGSVMTWEPEKKIFFNLNSSHINLMDFYILDKAGNYIDIGNQTVAIVFNAFL